MRIECIECHADRYRFSMPKTVLGILFEFVGRPMPVVQGASFLHLKGISAMGDMVQVHQDARANRRHDRSPISRCDVFGMLAKKPECRGTFEQRNFDRLGESRSEIAIG